MFLLSCEGVAGSWSPQRRLYASQAEALRDVEVLLRGVQASGEFRPTRHVNGGARLPWRSIASVVRRLARTGYWDYDDACQLRIDELVVARVPPPKGSRSRRGTESRALKLRVEQRRKLIVGLVDNFLRVAAATVDSSDARASFEAIAAHGWEGFVTMSDAALLALAEDLDLDELVAEVWGR
jgi:hypothetical protein